MVTRERYDKYRRRACVRLEFLNIGKDLDYYYYFSSSYCTIAAISTEGSGDDFLNPESDGQYVTLWDSSGPFYVREAIDDFQHDVDEGGLNQRGWVFQERALSRRRIHFTSAQTYWECGIGVHCETLTRMFNPGGSLLSNPEFPNRIRLFESLFERYSTLALTMASDRSVAILGINERLAKAFECEQEHGVFEKYLGRSLTWKRAGETLQRIDTPDGMKKVPSWSWVGYHGEIGYMDIKFGEVAWSNAMRYFLMSGNKEPHWEAQARELSPLGDGSYIIFDQARPYLQNMRCVVLGISAAARALKRDSGRKRRGRGRRPSREAPDLGQPCYVWVIAPTSPQVTCITYERVGVGCLQISSLAGKSRVLIL